MASGGFVGNTPVTPSFGNAGANSIYLQRVTAPQNGTATAILLDVNTGASGISFKALVYDGAHSALLATGSAVTAVTTGYNRLPLTGNLSLTAGTNYYVGYVCANTLPVTTGAAGTAWFVNGGQSVASPANPLVGGASSSNSLMIALELDGTSSPGFGFGPDETSGVTLSVSNTVATFTATANLGARSILTHTSGVGKYYAEITVGGTVNSGVGIGLAGVAWGTGQGTATVWAYVYLLAPGGARTDGANIGLTYVTGDTIGVAYDAGSNQMWWNKNNGIWNASGVTGNPATGSNGYVIQAQWPMALSVATGTTGTAAVFTLRETSAALLYAPPSGYSAWSPAGAVSSAAQARAMVLA